MRLKNSTVYFFTDKSPISKENSIWEEKFKIEFLRTQLEFFFNTRFIWIYWGFNCKKN
jgi:hypothetical protein